MGSLDQRHVWTTPVAGTGHNARVRVGEVEREAASSALAEHYASGRLTMDEYYERLDAAWSAHVRADLDMLFDDLPHGAAPTPPAGPDPSGRRPRPVRTIVVLVLLIVAALMVMGVPWWVPLVVAGGLVLLANKHHHRHHRHVHGHAVLHHHHGHHCCG